MPGAERIYTAGENEYYHWLERKDKGVPFSPDLLREFRELCTSYDMQEYLAYFQ